MLLAAEVPTTVVGFGVRTDAIAEQPMLTNVVATACSAYHNVSLRSDGTATGWGDNQEYFTGEIEALGALSDITSVSLGGYHGLALRSTGTVVAWGQGSSGENSVPAGLSGVIAISAGGRHNLVLKQDGSVVAWGASAYGQTNVPSGLANVIAISASSAPSVDSHNIALRSDGTVVAWGANWAGQTNVPAGLSNVVAISAGWSHNLALKGDGTVVAWGDNGAHQTDVPPGLADVVAIAAGAFHSAVLKADGTVVAWGSNNYGIGDFPLGLTNVFAISAGLDYTLALTRIRTPLVIDQPVGDQIWESPADLFLLQSTAIGPQPLTYQWSKDGVELAGATDRKLWMVSHSTNAGMYTLRVSCPFGSITSVPATITVLPYLAITEQPQNQIVYAGETATFSTHAIGSEPRSYQWRRNDLDLPGATGPVLSLANVQAVDASTNIVVVVSNAAGVQTSHRAKLIVNPNVFPVITLQPRSDVVFAGARMEFKVVAAGQGPLGYQWQKNGSDLPAGTGASLVFPATQSSDAGSYRVIVSNAVGTVTSDPATLGVTTAAAFPSGSPGTVVSLGGRLVPPGLTNVVRVAAGASHSLAIRTDGTVAAWGGNLFGQCNVPPGLSNVVAVAGSTYHSMALHSDGTIVSWGLTANVTPLTATGPFGVVAIAASQDYSLALKADGSVVTLGNWFGPTPASLSNVVAIGAAPYFMLAVKGDGTVNGLWALPNQPPFDPPSNVREVSVDRLGHILYVKQDGTVVGTGVPSGLSNVVAVAAGGLNMALSADGTATIWGGASGPTNLANVEMIAAGPRHSLLITTNPPPPQLAAQGDGQTFFLSAPVSVSGYVLEAVPGFSGSFTNGVVGAELEDGRLSVPMVGPAQFFRFRKQ